MKVFIVPREDGNIELEFARILEKELCEHKCNVIIQCHSHQTNIQNPFDKADIVISIGGDGTFLRTISYMNIQRPIIGINFGTVGFLTDIEKENAVEKILQIVNNPIKVEERMRIDVLDKGVVIGTSLNEISFRSDIKSMASFSVNIDGVIATEFKGDGLVISTPTGSTAYAMSAGGPITDPRIQGFLLVPIAPYLLSARSQVIHGSRKVIINADYGILYIDGAIYNQSPKEIEIKVSDKPALIVDIGRNFFEKVNTKLKTM